MGGILYRVREGQEFFVGVVGGGVEHANHGAGEAAGLGTQDGEATAAVAVGAIVVDHQMLLAVPSFLVAVIGNVDTDQVLVAAAATVAMARAVNGQTLTTKQVVVGLGFVAGEDEGDQGLTAKVGLVKGLEGVGFELVGPLAGTHSPPAGRATVAAVQYRESFLGSRLARIGDFSSQVGGKLQLWLGLNGGHHAAQLAEPVLHP